MTTTESLLSFIEAAEKNRNYPTNTANGIKAAFRVFIGVANDDEKASIDVFRDRIDPIYQEVSRKFMGKYSAGSIQTYKVRIQRLLNDYYKYGVDPTKMASWKSQTRTFTKKKKNESNELKLENPDSPIDMPVVTSGMSTYFVQLRNDARATLIFPYNLTLKEAQKLKNFIDLSVVESTDQTLVDKK